MSAHAHLLQLAQDHLARGQLAEAHACLLDVLRRDAQQPQALTLLGRLAWTAGDRPAACQAWQNAMRRDPSCHEAGTLLAEAALESGSAREAATLAERVIRAGDPRPDPWLTLIRARRQLADAIGCRAALRSALQRHPQNDALLWYGCVICTENRHYRDSADLALRLLARQPDHAGALVTLADAKARTSTWSDASALEQRLRGLLTRPGPDPGLIDAAFTWDDPGLLDTVTRAVAATLPPTAARLTRRQDPGRLTICYLSPDLSDHPVGLMLATILPHHDRSRLRVLTAGLTPPASDQTGTLIRSLVDGHLDLCPVADDVAAARIREAGVDILIDLAGATTRNRYGILAARPAPTQILWLGCPTGTGAGWYDALLLDGVVHPVDSQQAFREPVIRLPQCYHPIAGPAGERVAMSRGEAGLREDAIVLACTHSPHKVRPPLVDAWLRLAAANPSVVLWLDALDAGAREAITAYAAARGVEPAQLAFWSFQANRQRYLAQLALADLFLDNHPYGAHSTAGEALALGVPVITPGGRCVHARVAASMLTAMGLPQCIRNGLEDYEQFIAALCQDAAARQELQRHTREQVAAHLPAFNRNLTNVLEGAYLSVWSAGPVGP